MRRLIIFGAIAVAIIPTTAWAWGREGHEVVALIAAHELTPTARATVGELLGGDAAGTMADASEWADRIRRGRPETAPWHYVDIEIANSGYDPARDCPNGACVVAQIEKDVAVIGDRSLAKPIRAEALRFLIHLVGDLHQPLHSADNHDRGGNEVRVVVDGETKNLHAVWDNDTVAMLGDDPVTIATTLEGRITPQVERKWSRGSVADWANESFQIAKTEIYATLPGTGATGAPIILPPDYARREADITRVQLQRAGVRLAMLLNRSLSL